MVFPEEYVCEGVVEIRRTRLSKKPRHPVKPTRLYHGTAAAFGFDVEKEGLKTTGFAQSDALMKSSFSEKGYVYFFDDLTAAKLFACGTSQKIGLGSMGKVFVVNFDDVKAEPDPLLPRGSWRVKGNVPADILTPVPVDCKQEKVKMFGSMKSLWDMNKLIGEIRGS